MSAGRAERGAVIGFPMVGRCVRCGATYRVDDPVTADLGGTAPGFCGCAAPVHPNSFVRWRTIKVVVNTTKCGPRCRDAKSDKCACECGGDNHGRTFQLPLPIDPRFAETVADIADATEGPTGESEQ